MSSVFLSYASPDRERARRLAEHLAAAGHEVWWDQRMVPGTEFEGAIEAALNRAQAILVLWSESSVHSQWVQAEAAEGLERGILVPVLLEAVRPPLPFRHQNCADLARWDGKLEHPEMQRLLQGVDSVLAGGKAAFRPVSSPGRRGRTGRFGLWFGGLAVAAALLLWAYQQSLGPKNLFNSSFRSVAIAEIVNSKTGNRDYLGYGFSGQVRDLLSRVNGVAVASRTATDALAGKEPKQMGELLQVRYLLEGTVDGDADAFRMDLKLVDLPSGMRVWSERYSGDLDHLLELAYEASRRVLRSLEVDSAALSPVAGTRGLTEDAEALEYYLKGMDLLRRPPDDSILAQATQWLTNAVARDPTFARAYAGLCQAQLEQYQGSRAAERFEEGRANCQRALELDSQEVSAMIALADLHSLTGAYDEAIVYYQSALELAPLQPEGVVGMGRVHSAQRNDDQAERWFVRGTRDFPGYPEAHSEYGAFLMARGRLKEAAESFKAVVDLYPDSATAQSDLGTAYYLLGQFSSALKAWAEAQTLEESALAHANTGTAHFFLNDMTAARASYQAALALNSDDYRYWSLLGDACRMQQDASCADEAFAQALERAEARLAINPNDSSAHSMVAMCLAHLGQIERADEHAARALSLSPDDFYVHYDLAVAELRAGRRERSLARLESAVELGYPRPLALADPQLAAVSNRLTNAGDSATDRPEEQQ